MATTISYTRDDVGYPYVRLTIVATETARTASSVTLSLNVKVEHDGYELNPNYGGWLHISYGGKEYLNINYLPENKHYESSYGYYTVLYSGTHTMTINGLSSSATSITLDINSTSKANWWTSFIWTVPSGSSKVAISKGSTPVTSVSVSPTTLNLVTNGTNTGTLSATVSPSNATNKSVSWSSNNNNIATVDSSGKVTAKGNGSCTITVKTADGGKTASCTVNVTTAVTGVTLDKSNISLGNSGSTTLTATVAPSNASNKSVNWSSSNSNVAVYNKETGKVVAIGNGTCTITVTTVDGSKTASCSVTVTTAATGVTLNKDALHLQTNGYNTETLVATVSPANASNKSVTWSSSQPAYATVDGNGKVTAVANGQSTITVTDSSGNTDTCTVYVSTAVTGVSLNTYSMSLVNAGSRGTLTATISPSNASNKSVTWSSSNSSVAYYDTNAGQVVAAGNGTCTITVTTADGGKTASCSVTVTTAATGISLNKNSLILTTNEHSSEMLTATVTPANASNKTVTWTTSNGNVATVNNGNVVAKANGTCTITATNSAGHTATCSITVRTNVTGVSLNKSSMGLLINGNTYSSETLTATVSPSNASITGTNWSSSDSNIASVNNGTVTAKSNGTCIITVTKTDANGNTRSTTCTVTVTTAVTDISVTPTSKTLICNRADNNVTLSASIYPTTATNQRVIWKSSDTTIATVNSSGVVTANSNKKNGSCTITVTAADTTNGTLAATCSIKVIVGVESVTLSASSLELIVSKDNTDLRLANLTATVLPANAENKSIRWYTSDPDIATVKDGAITAIKGGSCTITVETVDGGKTANCNILSIDDKGPVGDLVVESDTTWDDEQCIRINHQEKYAITIDGDYKDDIVINNIQMNKVQIDGKKVWFRVVPKADGDIRPRCSSFQKPGDKWSNTSGGCAEIGHCSELITNSVKHISPKEIYMTYNYATLINATNKTAKIKLFGLNTNGYWVEIKVTNNQITSSGVQTGITINCESKNFFTQFRIGIFPETDNFITTCTLSNIRIIDYDKDASEIYPQDPPE